MFIEPRQFCATEGSQNFAFVGQTLAKVYLWVFEQNVRAQRFFQSHGFSWDGTRDFEDGLRAEGFEIYGLRYTLNPPRTGGG